VNKYYKLKLQYILGTSISSKNLLDGVPKKIKTLSNRYPEYVELLALLQKIVRMVRKGKSDLVYQKLQKHSCLLDRHLIDNNHLMNY
jgi:hypothetical protein